jgi:hypothetical protein
MIERLEGLRAEFEKGQQHLARLDQQRNEVRDTLLRISGAIQVLEELLATDAPGRHENMPLNGSKTETPAPALVARA